MNTKNRVRSPFLENTMTFRVRSYILIPISTHRIGYGAFFSSRSQMTSKQGGGALGECVAWHPYERPRRPFVPCKVIQDNIRFWILRRGFRIPGAGFRILPQQIPDSKTQKIPDFSFWFAPNFRISFSKNGFNDGFSYWRTCLWMHVCLFIFP